MSEILTYTSIVPQANQRPQGVCVAVADTFPEAWYNQKPATSRPILGAGIVGMGYVMDYLYTTQNAKSVTDFQTGLQALKGKTAWTANVWDFEQDNQRPWNSIQNVPKDVWC